MNGDGKSHNAMRPKQEADDAIRDRLAFAFSDSAYDEFMRYTSVPSDDPSSAMVTHEEFTECKEKGHVMS